MTSVIIGCRVSVSKIVADLPVKLYLLNRVFIEKLVEKCFTIAFADIVTVNTASESIQFIVSSRGLMTMCTDSVAEFA